MAQTIFDNMLRALQELSDAQEAEADAVFAQHNSWLSAVVSDAWQVWNGTGHEEDETSISYCAPARAARDGGDENANPNPAPVTVRTSPPKPPAPLHPTVVDANPIKTAGIAGAGRPPMPKRKGAAA